MGLFTRILDFIRDPMSRSQRTLKSREGSLTVQALKELFRGRRNRISIFILLSLVAISLLADLIANDKPLVATKSGSVYFPAFRGMLVDAGIMGWPKELRQNDWSAEQFDMSIYPPVPYSPENMDMNNIHSRSPFDEQNISSARNRHWLGTDELGRDVLAGMLHGTRTALMVGIISMGIALVLGIFLGTMAGYFGDHSIKLSRISIFMITLFFFLGIFWGFHSRHYILGDALSGSLLTFSWELFLSLLVIAASTCLGWLLGRLLGFIPWLGTRVWVPVDIIISRFIEVVVSIPTLFLIISVSALISKPSVLMVMVVIGLTSWPGIARFVRAEMLRIRSLEYIEAAKAMGYPEWRVIMGHALPNALTPLFITVAFGIASAVLIESTLSFLGVGVSAETVTWGSMLAAARQSTSAWWMALLPGGAIFVTVTIFNLIGEALTDALNPKNN